MEGEEKKVIVKNGIPGQKIRFAVNKMRKGKAEGRLLEVLEKSALEQREAVCSIFPECGGCMYQGKAGATTTWERWDALRPDGTVNETKMSGDNMVSFNHYSFGSVGKFYYQYILGIQPLAPGFAKVKIQPRFDERIGSFSGSYKDISVSYDGRLLHISTPGEAQIILPDGSIHEVGAGNYDFSVKE